MLRNKKFLIIMHNTGTILKSPYKLIILVKPSLHYLQKPPTTYLLHTLSHDILVCFIGFAIY